MKPLIYLELKQFANAIKNTIRTPKRLIPTLIIGAWIMSWLIHGLLAVADAPSPGDLGFGKWGDALQRLPKNTDMIEAGIFLFLTAGCIMVVYQAFSSGLMVFSIAHIDFLFPTPISRRKVLLVKLAKDYLKYGFWVAFFFIFLGSPLLAAIEVPLLPRGLAGIAGLTALLLLVVNVAHTINIVFTFGYERLKQAAVLIKAILIAAPASLVAYGVYQYAQTGDSYASILWAADSPVANAVFAPAHWCTSLILAPLWGITSQDYFHLAMLWVLAAASFVLLLSRRENLYEPSLGISVKYAKRRQAMRAGDVSGVRMDEMRERGAKRPNGLSIPPFGRGAVALFWRDLATKFRLSRGQLIFLLAVFVVAAVLVRQFVEPKWPSVLRQLPFVLIYLTWIFSIAFQPMRAELKHADILKSMPVQAWKVVLAQTLNRALYVGVGVSALAASMWAILPHTRGELLLLCGAGAPFFGFACIAVAVIPSLLYPDTRDTTQNYICGPVGFMLSLIAIVPTIVIGVVLIAIANVPYYYALITVSAVNVAIGTAAVTIAGCIFHRFDPTSQ